MITTAIIITVYFAAVALIAKDGVNDGDGVVALGFTVGVTAMEGYLFIFWK